MYKHVSKLFPIFTSMERGPPKLLFSSGSKTDENFIKSIQANRVKTAASIREFTFNKRRGRKLNNVDAVPEKSKGIAYWMARDQRVQDNWALLFAQNLALNNQLPLHVIFCLTDKFLNSPLRHYKFMLDGLEEVTADLNELNINFHLLRGNHTTQIPKFIKDFNIGALVCDFSPLRIHREWVDGINATLPKNVPFIQVDAHNVVPLWVSSDQFEQTAPSFRGKIRSHMNLFLTEFPPLIRHPYSADKPHQSKKIDWKGTLESLEVDKTVGEVDWLKPGYRGAVDTLNTFIKTRLKFYEEFRNSLDRLVNSNMSPYFHFGHIAPQRAALEVKKYDSKEYSKGVEKFLEQSIVRRELCDNFCYYNPNYDNIKGIPEWAMKTLNDHRNDKREYIYTLQKFEDAQTHDDIWNAAQIQMKKEGKMHGFLRMYWAKKILEWTNTPEEALEIAFYLNDRYNIDGRDPNGYNGVMWSIGGVHDHPFKETKVFGKIRIMTYNGCKGKFDVPGFVRKYGATKVFKK